MNQATTGIAPAHAWRATILSSAALALALMGDQLLYVVLPLHADAFGMSIFWVGILLSANRWIRVLAYGEVARLGHRLGAKRLTILASLGAAVSTTAYAWGQGEWLLLASRILWGLSYAGFSLTVTVYALGDGTNAGKRLGLSRALCQAGPALAAFGGAWLTLQVGPRDVFYVLGVMTAIAIPLALALPDDAPPEQASAARAFAWPNSFDLFSFANGFTAEGIFMVTVGLLFAQDTTLTGAVLAAGLAVAARHLVVIAVGPIGGILVDRFGPDAILLIGTILVVGGFAMVPFDLTALGVAAILIGRGLHAVVGALIVTRRVTGNPMVALSANATWRDLGAALGPSLAGLVIGLVSLEAIYAAMAAMVAALYLNFVARSSKGGVDPQHA